MTTGPVRACSEWLRLREPADAAARASELVEKVRSYLPTHGGATIHDLGCGTGSMAHWLAVRLPGPQHWVMYDRDDELLTVAERVPTALQPRRPAEAHTRWTSRAMTCSTPRRRARTARRLLSCHLGRTSRSWWCTVTDRWPAAACARRRLAYDGAWARSSGRCLHAPASQPVNHAAKSAA